MAVKMTRRATPTETNNRKSSTTVLMGSYMPFTGVRYYVLKESGDAAVDVDRVPAVGWRRSICVCSVQGGPARPPRRLIRRMEIRR